jgi:hypothetical protein
MNEVVVAVYRSASAAEAAVEDLKVARVPSATIRQFVSDPAAQEGLLELHNRSIASGDRVVTVTVEDLTPARLWESSTCRLPSV